MRFQDAHGILPVLQLGTGFGIVHRNSGGKVTDPDTGLHLVHILSSCSTRPESIPFNVGWIHHNFDGFINDRSDKNRGKRGMPPVVGIKG